MDLACREILGWNVDDNMEADLVCTALKNAVSNRGCAPRGVIILFDDIDDARTGLFDYIEIFYNRDRMHSGIGYQIPVCYVTPGVELVPEFVT